MGNRQFKHSKKNRDITQIYLMEISRHPLLSAEKERELAYSILKGDKLAKQRMIVSNLRFVVKLARRYLYRGLPLSDLIEEGNLGLMRAVEKFDPNRGFRFSTYATWWIRQAIDQAIMGQVRIIRLPIHVLRKYKSCLKEEEISEDRNADLEEIDTEKSKKIKNNILTLKPKKAANLAKITFLDQDSLEDFPDLCEQDPIRLLEQEDLKEYLEYWLSQLPAKHKEIIVRRFGLLEHEPQTLEEVGRKVGITPERVRQIQVSATKRLKKLLEKDGYS